MATETSTRNNGGSNKMLVAGMFLAGMVVGGAVTYMVLSNTCPAGVFKDPTGVCWFVGHTGSKTQLPGCPKGC